jgi:hypothetical protein
MPRAMNKISKFRSIKLTDQSHFFLRCLAAEERTHVSMIAAKIIEEYYKKYQKDKIQYNSRK